MAVLKYGEPLLRLHLSYLFESSTIRAPPPSPSSSLHLSRSLIRSFVKSSNTALALLRLPLYPLPLVACYGKWAIRSRGHTPYAESSPRRDSATPLQFHNLEFNVGRLPPSFSLLISLVLCLDPPNFDIYGLAVLYQAETIK
ncbi:hypothetical protein G7Y89_g12504 [Cudoniella acicularis]|uniref:Uncharacterized protein n=1 Tax=Cudoniella acicularis TaxID=354080 RepID=A0A8H4VZL2_9HELO|nr:hypothetical protein G7Y89_g12504 [Cudoniella acicularis]